MKDWEPAVDVLLEACNKVARRELDRVRLSQPCIQHPMAGGKVITYTAFSDLSMRAGRKREGHGNVKATNANGGDFVRCSAERQAVY